MVLWSSSLLRNNVIRTPDTVEEGIESLGDEDGVDSVVFVSTCARLSLGSYPRPDLAELM